MLERTWARGAAAAASTLVMAGVLVAEAPSALANGCSWFVAGHAGTQDDPNPISTAADLGCLQQNSVYWDDYFVQTADIDLGGATWSTGIGTGPSASSFSGTYDGDLHTISGLAIESSSPTYLGLFGHLTGTLRDVRFAGRVTATDAVGEASVGGLVGYNVGEVSGSSSSGPVQGAGDYAYVGGLVGRIDTGGTVAGSYATGSVSAGGASNVAGGLIGYNWDGSVSDSYATGNVTANGSSSIFAGGLVGLNYNNVTGATITRSYSTGAVTGTGYVGGLVGLNFSGTVSESFWDTQMSGESSSSGGTGKTTAEMTALSTFSGWSISEGWSPGSTWGICSRVNSGYPYLTSFHTANPCLTGPVRYTFTFDTSNGGICFHDTQVAAGPYVLPTSQVACTPEGTELVGWTIPGQERAFSDGGTVIASADQTFTAVAKHSDIDVTYDANVGNGTACLADGLDTTTRTTTTSTLRTGTLAATPPCTPVGVTFTGWTDRPTTDGPSVAVDGALTLPAGDPVPASWSADPNPVNAITLYALWSPTG